ncbi:helix-turn-helix domain-containing protein [Acetobacter pomorum]|uniref:helix-turn-helix domain-containing protein n=1 Tax=Acetobacter pomorum TaxID=65959 RepID=UPI0012705C59|nr:helix-turn-helix domain-containing protein [Acetobacter pomorum]KAA8419969.1 helix-turn-helix domain-containing protein [Acetobacter pomorum]KAA8435529.1 helix-turn-helix domain-containing protein [Acetobacter pomorum]KAA8448338.1 helix-turn-helix domain-containing protein [Acetobacter pomorum]
MSKNPPKRIEDRDPKKVAFGIRVRIKREQKGFTQAELGRMIGLSENSVVQYETGRAVPKTANFERLAEALGVSSRYLLTGDVPDELSKAQTEPELKALEILRSVPPTQQGQILDALKLMAQLTHTKK